MEEQSVGFQYKCFRGPITGHNSSKCAGAWMCAEPLDLACHHQAVSKRRPCAIADFFTAAPDVRRERMTHPVRLPPGS